MAIVTSVTSVLLVQMDVSSCLSDLAEFAMCAFRVTYQDQDLSYHQFIDFQKHIW